FIRRNQLSALTDKLYFHFPNINWWQLSKEYLDKLDQPEEFKEQIAFYFDRSELQEIAFYLGVDIDEFLVEDYLESVGNFLNLIEQTELIEDTYIHMKTVRPHVDWKIPN
ncbi:MAG: hypothetical protein AAGD96_13620, partial [Chloroflexota bacterium]